MRPLSLVFCLALLGSSAPASSQEPAGPIPPALAEMADAERAFARRATEVGVRDAFIEFFADEAINFEPDPTPARESLRRRPPPPPGVSLVWEPRQGDVAASGDLGYLTGPFRQSAPGRPDGHGNYFSIWKRQADGAFRVILDVGTGTPAAPVFAPGLLRAPAVATWTTTAPDQPASVASLLEADRKFAAGVATGVAEAYATTFHPEGRLLRNGVQPMTARGDAVAWIRQHVAAMTSEPIKQETGASGDLGYTWGRFTATSAAGERTAGYYVRVWTRQADGSWLVAAEVTNVSPPRPPQL